MTLQTEWIRYGARREHLAYVAHLSRAAQPLPAIVVLHEAFGVDEHIEDVTRRFANAGYFAIAPDLFSVDGERPAQLTHERLAEFKQFMNETPPTSILDPVARAAALATRPADSAARISETITAVFGRAFKPDTFVGALLATTSFLRAENAATRGQKIGAVGFCMGGGLSAQLAGHDPALAAAVIFYGMPPAAEVAARIQCPVLGLYAETDKRIVDALPAFVEVMRAHDKSFEPHIYPGAAHAFFNDTRPPYHVSAARDAFARTLELFRRTLA